MMHLETDRLIICEFKEKDIDELAPILADPKVMKYSLKGPLDQKEAEDYLDQRILQHYKKYDYGLWALVDKKTKKLIGMAGPIVQKIEDEELVEIGYRIIPNLWGKGLATEAVIAIKNFVFSNYNLDKVIAIIEPTNLQSIKVAKKAGFNFSRKAVFHGFSVDIYQLNR